jgi:hypothetical protein
MTAESRQSSPGHYRLGKHYALGIRYRQLLTRNRSRRTIAAIRLIEVTGLAGTVPHKRIDVRSTQIRLEGYDGPM